LLNYQAEEFANQLQKAPSLQRDQKQLFFECSSLRSKRFCGVWEQRITARKMERVKEGGGGGEGRKEGNACRQTPEF